MRAGLQRQAKLGENFRKSQLSLGAFEEFKVLAQAENWEFAIRRDIGSAYATAVASHKAVLAKQSASDAVDKAIVFGLLTLATVGTLSWVSSGIQNNIGSFVRRRERRVSKVVRPEDYTPYVAVVEAVEDIAKAGAGVAVGNVAPIIRAPNLNPVSEEPQVYQNDKENEVSAVMEELLLAFGKIKQAAGNAPLEAWDKYDDAEQQKLQTLWETDVKTLAGRKDLPTVTQMAEEFERSIWAKYVLEARSHRHVGPINSNGEDTPDDVGMHVYNRLMALGVRVNPYGTTRPNSDELTFIVRNAWSWSKLYRVTDFVTLKKKLTHVGPEKIKVPQ